jgi:hypothetical protein
MVGVVQLVERQVVILNVAGSSPVTHPKGQRVFSPSDFFLSGTRDLRISLRGVTQPLAFRCCVEAWESNSEHGKN